MEQNNIITYKDFKIGQKVTCVRIDEPTDFWEQHLTIGKVYKIVDVDFHFWDKICVRSDNRKFSHFVPIKFFVNEEDYIRILREKKLKRITKNE